MSVTESDKCEILFAALSIIAHSLPNASEKRIIGYRSVAGRKDGSRKIAVFKQIIICCARSLGGKSGKRGHAILISRASSVVGHFCNGISFAIKNNVKSHNKADITTALALYSMLASDCQLIVAWRVRGAWYEAIMTWNMSRTQAQ